MAKQNMEIIKKGAVQGATKLAVITIGIGRVCDLQSLTFVAVEGDEERKIIWRDESGNVVIATKEHPEGDVYPQDLTAVVRVVGGKVFINGLYDVYVPAAHKIEKLLSNPIDLAEVLNGTQLEELQPMLDVASEVRPSIAPAEPGRKVVVITEEMLGGAESMECVCTWHEDSGQTTKLYAGDVFLIEDEAKGHGYRIGAQEFAETHELVAAE